MPPAKPRLGLVLGGGGARGAFTSGVIDYLRAVQKIRNYPVISGTSTGALIGTLVCSGQFAMLRKIYTTVQVGDIINPHLSLLGSIIGPIAAGAINLALGGKAMFSAQALAELIDQNADFDLVKEKSADCLLIYNTVDLISGDVVRYTNRQHAKSTLAKALLASASEPVFMDPVTIGDKQLTDGGVRDLVPLEAAFDSGVEVDAFLVVLTNPLDPEKKSAPVPSGLDILGRTVDLLLTEVGVNDLKLAQTVNALVRVIQNARDAEVADDVLLAGLDQGFAESIDGKRSVPIIVVAPKERLEVDSLSFDPTTMQRMFDQGINRGQEVLEPILENWPPPILEI